MKTYREIIYSIKEFVSGFHVTDDNPLDDVLIAKKIDDVRAELIKQQYNQNRSVEDLFYQLCDVKIKREEIVEGNDIFQKERLYRFTITFPELMPNVEWANIKYLGDKDFLNNYNRRSMDGFNAASGRYWSRNMIDYTIIGTSQALVKYVKKKTKIVALALFKSPMDVPGMTWNDGYPVPDPFKLEMIVKQDIVAGLQVPPDEKNDAKHNTEQLTQQQR